MKHIAFILNLLLIMLSAAAPARADKSPEMLTMASGSNVKVYYSFDHYANNPNMARGFVSEDMLKAATSTGLLQSTAWDLSQVVSRLKSVLTLHTHSRSTTKQVRQDLEKVSSRPAYERLMHTRFDNSEFVVFCHRKGRSKDLDELLIFKFRDNYCSRVIQLTGKIRVSDITSILKMSKK